ncbi:hypothetical protein [Neisseria musculi]|uniref:hypothetical protein n=1 Tax=Neisseria musculi TaxID=1815583 RepID=UPI00164BE3B5|nr:hypothetical protein [Neisseria musculi]
MESHRFRRPAPTRRKVRPPTGNTRTPVSANAAAHTAPLCQRRQPAPANAYSLNLHTDSKSDAG